MTEIRLEWLNKVTNICLHVIMRKLMQGRTCTLTLKIQTVLWFQKTVVFVLMVFVFALENIKSSWSVKIDHNKYINIGKVVKYLGNDLALKHPHIHAITGCVTTSFMFSVGKQKCMKQVQKVRVLNGFGETSAADYKKFQKVSTICYAGLEIENLVESRARLYSKMKTKTLLTLPPDPQSME